MDNNLLSGKQVLVIEDEMLVLMGLQDMLSDLGCTSISVAGSVQNAVDLIAEYNFDVATLDVNLKGTPSYEVADALEAGGVPFAFSTGYGEHGINQDYRHRPIINKPFSRAQFETVIGSLLSVGVPPEMVA